MNYGNLSRIQKIVGILFFSIFLVLTVVNFILIAPVNQQEGTGSCISVNIAITWLFSMIFLATAVYYSTWMRFIQVGLLFSAGHICILDNPSPHYYLYHGIGLVFLSVILAIKYRYFEKKTLKRYIIYGGITTLTLSLAVKLNPAYGSFVIGLRAMGFICLLLSVFQIIYLDELHTRLIFVRKSCLKIANLKLKHETLQKNIEKDSERLEELNASIAKFLKEREKLNLDDYKLTVTEKKVIQILCTYRCSNKELASRLKITVSTVKNHLSHIMDKLGVDDRYAVIDMCRNNFIEE